MPGSSATERQLDLRNEETTGSYTRPRVFSEAERVDLTDEGGLVILWKGGLTSVVAPASVSSYAYE